MAQPRSENDRSARPAARAKKKGSLISRHLVPALERVDFVDLLRRIAESKPGRPWLDHFSRPGALQAPEQERYLDRAVELTLAEFAERGEEVDPAQVRGFAGDISTRYDPEIHRHAAAAICTLMTHLFDQADPWDPFVSPGRRELAHIDELKAHRAQGRGVVYLVNHSSHVDEFIADVVFNYNGLGLPIFAAGTNMMAIKSLAKVLICGSYTVQRRGAGKAYLATLYNYCRALSDCGGQQGIFLEAWHGGARSRDGSLRYPRRLVTLRGAIDVEGEVVVQPVAISYAAVPEDLSLAARGGPRCWVNGLGLWRTLAHLALHPKSGLWRAAKGLYGRAYCTLTRPRTLGELKEMHARDVGGLAFDEFVALTAIKDIAQAKKIMASQLVAGAIWRQRRGREAEPAAATAGAAKPARIDLVQALEREIGRVRDYHQSAFGAEPDLEDLVTARPAAAVLADGLATLRRRRVLAGRGRDETGLPRVMNPRGLAFYATHGDRRLYSPQAKENIVVVGGGDWGCALAHLVGARILEERRYQNHSLTLYDPRPEVAAELGLNRSLPGKFENERLPKNVFVTNDAVSAFKKASEVILATPPESFAAVVDTLLKEAEQPIRVVVATTAFEPARRAPTWSVAAEAAARLGRRDVEVYAYCGPVSDEDLIRLQPALGVLAGPEPGLAALADLFAWQAVEVSTCPDPAGAQVAAIMAQVYALWGGYLLRMGQIRGAAAVGRYMVKAGTEAQALALALGGRPETFSALSPAWTVSFTAAGLSGPVLEFGKRLGKEARRAKDLPAQAARLYEQGKDEGSRVRAYQELDLAHRAATGLGLSLPILAEAHAALWGD
ncbi:MAG: 1-acyl-sn-glycerol-3-phosphate acyltransferase [Thermodesulfobacteriota bacterium]